MTQRRMPAILATAALCAATLALTLPGAAQQEAASREVEPRYTGVYRYAESDARGQRRIREAARAMLAQLNPVVRLIAEGRINAAHVPPTIRMRVNAPHIAVRFVDHEGEESPLYRSRAGYPTDIVTRDGDDARLTQHFRAGRFEQIFEGERGRWYNLFTLDESGDNLLLQVVLAGERLDTPIRVELPYRRVAAR